MSGRKGSLREERSSTVRAVGFTRTGRAGGRGGARRAISPYSSYLCIQAVAMGLQLGHIGCSTELRRLEAAAQLKLGFDIGVVAKPRQPLRKASTVSVHAMHEPLLLALPAALHAAHLSIARWGSSE